jgi:poly(3-hydroxybutyrate) depolymerase
MGHRRHHGKERTDMPEKRNAVRLGLLVVAGVLGGSLAQANAIAQDGNALPQVDANTPCLLLQGNRQSGRSPFHTDPVEAQIVAGNWRAPKAGDEVTTPAGSKRRWQPGQIRANGVIPIPPGGYAYLGVRSPRSCVMMLEASGHGFVYVNGEPRTGDVYGYGIRLPVKLKEGVNDFLFLAGRGDTRAHLMAPKPTTEHNAQEARLELADQTVPDLVLDEPISAWAAVIVQNLSTEPSKSLALQATWAGATGRTVHPIPTLPPLSMRKFGFFLEGAAPKAAKPMPVELRLVRSTGNGESPVLDMGTMTLNVLRPEQTRRETFVSKIDGSVQYYALVPARKEKDAPQPGLILTLHGASVEALGQAGCYAARPWTHIVAPTNRRPYGFDWEDWGRLDAIEVLELTHQKLHTDPTRTYLTGHSMGGHGTWQIGVTYPDRFAAIAPSAGWVSFWSYGGARRANSSDPVVTLFQRATLPSDTLALAANYKQEGIYILHGDRDDNVPVSEARAMRGELGRFHPDFAYHEKTGAGHWWGGCVDWPPLMEFLAAHRLPERGHVRDVEFTTASPGVSAKCHWLTIEAQQHFYQPSSVKFHAEPDQRRFQGSTQNVGRLALDLAHLPPGKAVAVEIDGQKLGDIAWPSGEARLWFAGEARLWFARDGERWLQAGKPDPLLKGPNRYGSFKDAFRNRVVFVYGTTGSAEENAWAMAKARLDAETFWYRGNASVDVIADTEFTAATEPNRNVILYGNANTNSAWRSLLGDSPVQVDRKGVRIGEKSMEGGNLACLFIRPRPGSANASVGVVGGTGLPGMRLTERLPIFMAGIAYPDCSVFSTEMLTKGTTGLLAAGYFGVDWSVSKGEFVWR